MKQTKATVIVYDSLMGTTEKFIQQIAKNRPDWKYLKIAPNLVLDETFNLITYTIGSGEIPPATKNFLERNSEQLLSVSSSGNRNLGAIYAVAADQISQQYNVPILAKFEVADGQKIINKIINQIEREQ